jgi:DNA-binding response OmpR family regulator
MLSRHALSVLIVEDDPLVALDEAEIVESFGYAVAGVADEAAETYRLAERQLPNIALLDVNLADGRTGPAICARLIEAYGVAVVFVTGNPELLPENFAGALGCITKPYAPQTLGAALSFVRRHVIEGQDAEPPSGLRPNPAFGQLTYH